MYKKLKNFLSKATGSQQLLAAIEEQTTVQAYIAWMNLLSQEKYSDRKRLSKAGFKVYSQAEEDGFIHEIFRRIGCGSRTFMEIGVSNGRESNTAYLLRQGWKGVWIEGSPEYAKEASAWFSGKVKSGDLVVACEYVTRENADSLVSKLLGTKVVDILSIDIDGNDFHILEALKTISPRAIVLEYNPVFLPPIEWVMPYNPGHIWDGSDHYGASLKSYELMLREKGYSLVGCTTNGNNAFFVRTELTGELFCSDTSAENHYEPQRFWLGKAFGQGYVFGRGPDKG
ncbi:MAG: hypothetical protein A2049_04725 [Elusimicrobia bacterium GWA2_62_23]|nr:MAG: hypothetical protein A2049_04725 [Elusimicrobia bacterium GWA2_62_23]